MAERVEIAEEMKEVLSGDGAGKSVSGQAAAVPEADKVVELAVEKDEKDGEAAGVETKAKEAEAAEEHKNRVSAKDRIRQFRRKLGDSEREKQALQQEIERLKAGAAPESKEPKRDAYGTDDEYLEAVVNYRADQKANAAIKAKEIEDGKTRQQQAAAQVQTEWAKKQAKALEKDPEFRSKENAVIEDIQDYQATNLFSDILESDKGAELVVYFHDNPDELERVASLRPSAASREIGKIESKLADKPVKKSPPPPPTATIRGSATVSKDIGRMSQEEYNKYMNERGL